MAADPAMSPQQAGAAGTRQAQLGQQVQRAAQGFSEIILDVQNRVNTTKVMEAENRLREAALKLTYDKDEGFLNLKGDAAVTRPNGNSLTSEYGDKLDQTAREVEADLANDVQREAFKQRATQIGMSFRGQTTQHELQEFRAYSASVAEGTIAIRQRELVLDARDPAKVSDHTTMIASAVGELGKLNGWSATDIERRARSVVSQAHRLVLDDAIEKGDIEFADLYRMKYKDAMDADDILAIEGKWNRTYDAHIAMGAADGVFDALGQPVSSFERQIDAIFGRETGHINNTAGKMAARSPKGAMGIGQIMPETAPEAAKLAGEAWDPERYRTDEKYQRDLARAYYRKQLQTFGNAPAAMAAYNAGPGVVQDWIDGTNRTGKNKAGVRLGRPTSDWRAWASALPYKETREYVLRAMADATAGSAPAASLGEAMARLRSDPQLAGSPQRLALAEQRLKSNWAIRESDQRDREQSGLNAGIKHVLSTRGDLASIPPSVWEAAGPQNTVRLLEFAQKITSASDVTSPKDYMQLQGLLADPDRLRKLAPRDIESLRLNLSTEDYRALVTRYEVLQGRGPSDPKLGTEIRYTEVNRAIDNRLVGYGLQTDGKSAREEDVARKAAIVRTVQTAVDNEQRTLGRQLNDREINEVVDRTFSAEARFHPGKFMGGWNDDPAAIERENLFGMKAGDIPKSERREIEAELTARGALASEDNILGAYFYRKGLQLGVIKPIGQE